MAKKFIQRILFATLLLAIQSCIRISHLGCYGLSTSSAKKTNKQHANKHQAGSGFGNNKQNQEKQYISILDYNNDDQKNEQFKIYKQLIETLQSHKAVLDGTEIGIHPQTGQRGLYATKPFSKGKIVCKIPSDLALALGDPALKGVDAPTFAHAAAKFWKFYVQDPRAAFQWKFYLDCLFPPSFNNNDDDDPHHKNTFLPMTPDFYTDEEIGMLEFPRIVQAAKQRKRDIQQVAAETGIPIDELQRATAIVSSRSIPLAISEVESNDKEQRTDDRGQILSKAGERAYIRLLVPYIDMANHRSKEFNAAITILDPEKDEAWFALQVTRNIPIGKEITVAYGSGADTSIELLLNYGFVEPGNPMDAYLLKKEKKNQNTPEDCIATISDWTTTLDEDKAMLAAMTENDDDANHLQNILRFRIQMKESYSQ